MTFLDPYARPPGPFDAKCLADMAAVIQALDNIETDGRGQPMTPARRKAYRDAYDELRKAAEGRKQEGYKESKQRRDRMSQRIIRLDMREVLQGLRVDDRIKRALGRVVTSDDIEDAMDEVAAAVKGGRLSATSAEKVLRELVGVYNSLYGLIPQIENTDNELGEYVTRTPEEIDAEMVRKYPSVLRFRDSLMALAERKLDAGWKGPEAAPPPGTQPLTEAERQFRRDTLADLDS